MSRSRKVDDQNNLISLPGLLTSPPPNYFFHKHINDLRCHSSDTRELSELPLHFYLGVLMTRFSKTLIALAALSTLAANAALFDTLESVDTLQKVAAQKQTTDRSPAGKVIEVKAEQEREQSKPVDDSKK